MTNQMYVTDSICRACLEPIFEKCYPLTGQLVFDIDLDIASMIEFCTSSKLNLSGDLPDQVCLPCFKTIRICYRFLKHFYAAQTKLNKLTVNLPVKVEVENPCITVEANGSKQYFSSLNNALSEAAIKNNAEVAECSAYENETESVYENEAAIKNNAEVAECSAYKNETESVYEENEAESVYEENEAESVYENEAEGDVNESNGEDDEAAIKNNAEVAEYSGYENEAESVYENGAQSVYENEAEGDVNESNAEDDEILYENDAIDSINEYEVPYSTAKSEDEESINENEAEGSLNDNEADASLSEFENEDVKFDAVKSERVVYDHQYFESASKVAADEIAKNNPKIEVVIERNSQVDAQLYYFICPVCGEKFSRIRVFRSHVAKHNLPKIKCNRCPGQPELEKNDYIQHYVDHHKYHCDICNKILTTDFGFKYHMKLHATSEKVKCPVKGCRRMFLTVGMLKHHMKVHYNTPKIYPCHLCSSTFYSKDNLVYHLKKHSGKRDYLCSICGQAFYQSVTLRDHMYRHTGYRRYVCEVCGKGFISTGGLKKHERYCSRNTSFIKQAKKIQK